MLPTDETIKITKQDNLTCYDETTPGNKKEEQTSNDNSGTVLCSHLMWIHKKSQWPIPK